VRRDALGDRDDRRVTEALALGQRTIGLDDDLVLLAEGANVALLEERAHLDLSHGRGKLGVASDSSR
jgi:hypothetical protein